MADPILIDGNSVAVRCIMAAAVDEVANNLPFNGGIHGTLNLLSNLLGERVIKAGRIVACFDHAPPPRRYRLIPGYKEKPETDEVSYPFETEEQKEEAFGQLDHIRAALQTLGVTCLCYKQREADDVLAALARIYIDRGERPIIVTSDKDMWQTVGWGARIWDLTKKELIDAGNFCQRATVSTDTFLLYKALLGDPSDKIQGVRGMGKKTIPALFERAHWDIRICREPKDQLASLCHFLGTQPKRTKAEAAVIRDRRRIERVIQGIDLRTSFGPVEALTARLDEDPPKVDWRAFCRVFKGAGLGALLGAHGRYTTPFARAAKNARAKGENVTPAR
jgi:5'-3' exonuclease